MVTESLDVGFWLQMLGNRCWELCTQATQLILSYLHLFACRVKESHQENQETDTEKNENCKQNTGDRMGQTTQPFKKLLEIAKFRCMASNSPVLSPLSRQRSLFRSQALASAARTYQHSWGSPRLVACGDITTNCGDILSAAWFAYLMLGRASL